MLLPSGRALRWIGVVWSLSGLLAGTGAGPRPGQPRPEEETGSALSAKEAADLVGFHNKVRKDAGTEPVKWSPALARFAQQWADEVHADDCVPKPFDIDHLVGVVERHARPNYS